MPTKRPKRRKKASKRKTTKAPCLTPKQKAFIDEYLVDLNATQAAIRAGYASRTANRTGTRLLSNVVIAAKIQAALEARSKRVQVEADDVLRELKRIALSDLRQAFDENGNLKPIHGLPEDIARAISGLEVDELFEGHGDDRERVGRTKKVKFWDKTKALELLGKHLAMWIERREHSGPGGGPIKHEYAEMSDDELRRIANGED